MADSMADDNMDLADQTMDLVDDEAYQCKACGENLEGKAYELTGSRWHFDCFRCTICNSLLSEGSNLLLLDNGSLICSGCNYTCAACGNHIEDLAILTGGQAFCASCFRCRHCKRKIDNLCHVRTPKGILCVDCNELLASARRRRKPTSQQQGQGQQQSRRTKEAPMSKEKSLPALPPDVIPRGAFDPPPNVDGMTELSPRPRQQPAGSQQSKTEPSSRSSSRPARSPERTNDSSSQRDGPTLQPNTYRRNRVSALYQNESGANGDNNSNADDDGFFIPVALDPTPPAASTPRPSDGSGKPAKKAKDNDYFGQPRSDKDTKGESLAETPHIAFQAQQQDRQSSSEYETPSAPKQSRRLSKSSRNDPLRSHPPDDAAQKPTSSGKSAAKDGEDFKLQEAPKSKRSGGKENITVRTSMGPARRERDAVETPDRPIRSQTFAVDDEFLRSDSGSQAISRKEVPPGGTPKSNSNGNNGAMTLRHVPNASPAMSTRDSLTGTPIRPTTADDDHNLTLTHQGLARPPAMGPKLSDTYMQPRAPPAPPVQANTPRKDSAASSANPNANDQAGTGSPKPSPKLPRWSAGGDFSMDEDMARILGAEESANVLRRISTAARHGRAYSTESHNHSRSAHTRSTSEMARGGASLRLSKPPPLSGDQANSHLRYLGSPVSMSPTDDPALLRRQLKTSEQRVAELERKFATENDIKNLTKKLMEKRKTVSVLDTQAEIMVRQLESLAGVIERAKQNNGSVDMRELEETAVKDLWQKLEKVKITFMASLEHALEEREAALEDKERAAADRDRALVEFEQLSIKNAQLVDMNNDLTHQIQERFKSQASAGGDAKASGLGIYSHSKNGSTANLDISSLAPSGGSSMLPDGEDAIVETGPTVVQVRRVQGKKFNWKKGKAVAQNMAKGVNRAVVAFQQQDREKAPYGGFNPDNIGLPYNMTAAQGEAPTVYAPSPANGPQTQQQSQQSQTGPQHQHQQLQQQLHQQLHQHHHQQQQRNQSQDQSGGKGFAFFNRNKAQMPKSMSTTNVSSPTAVDAATTLFGSDLTERTDFERRQIPNVVSRCIEEVELRGMDVEGIYRKTGGNSQVKAIQDGFSQSSDFDISDPDIDITAVTSVLKQYFRKLPVPLLTFDVYERILESNAIADESERCTHLKKTFATMPQSHGDCLEFLMFHLGRVAQREPENLMSPKNLAVVFAPTIMRDTSLEREITDMHAKNIAVQFIIENISNIFAD
jgi:hypothetical protein